MGLAVPVLFVWWHVKSNVRVQIQNQAELTEQCRTILLTQFRCTETILLDTESTVFDFKICVVFYRAFGV